MNMRSIVSYLFFEKYATWSSSCKFSEMYSIVHFIAGLWKVQFSNTTGSYWVRQNTVIFSRRYRGISAYPKKFWKWAPPCIRPFKYKSSKLIVTQKSLRAPVAQLVEDRAVTREVVSSTPAGPTLRVLKELSRKCCLCNYISKWLDFQVFSEKDYKP